MKIAIIGTGIAGLTAAYLLNKKHEITVFERDSRIGGHTATKAVELNGNKYNIDTGFIVFNDWTYPNFIRLMKKLNVAHLDTKMSFSVSNVKTRMEYAGSSLNTLFSQRSNLLKPSFYKMIRDILKFNKIALEDLSSDNLSEDQSLGSYLSNQNFSDKFVNDYLVPMGSAIWSTSQNDMLNMPALFFIRFFKNHGLLSIKNRPTWRVIKGGSSSYITPLVADFNHKIELNCQISKVERLIDTVRLHFNDGSMQSFDQVVFACHSDQALELLSDPDETEKDILGAIPYLQNQVTLHTDETLLPKRRKAWSAWNYQTGHSKNSLPVLSYDMNILQHIESDTTFVVSLNADHLIDSDKILGQYHYAHPQFNLESVAAQQRWSEINGVNRTWFCGAYWKNGFHEDGCESGIRVARGLGVEFS